MDKGSGAVTFGESHLRERRSLILGGESLGGFTAFQKSIGGLEKKCEMVNTEGQVMDGQG